MPSDTIINSITNASISEIKVGVIIPTYNRPAYLKQAILSVLLQSHKNSIVYVMDDGGFSSTINILNDLNDSRINFITNSEQLGLAKNITKGVNLLPDDIKWCMVVCDDDYIAPDFIELMLDSIVNRGIKNIIHSQIVFVDEFNKIMRNGLDAPEEESAYDFVSARANFKRDRYLTGIMFSRDKFNQIGGYPDFKTGMAADDALIFALAIQDNLFFEGKAISYIRIHNGAESCQIIGIDKHFEAISQYGNYCKEIASKYCKAGSKTTELDRHVKALNIQLWNQALNSVKKNKELWHYEKTIYRIGLNPDLKFSIRIRISSFLGLYAFCPEKIGLYRSIWKRIGKVSSLINNSK